MSLSSFCSRFRRLLEQEDGAGVSKLCDVERGYIPMRELLHLREAQIPELAGSQQGDVHGEVLSLYLLFVRAGASGDTVRELEYVCTCLKTWVQRYIEMEGNALWATPLLIYLSAAARQVAIRLDQSKRSEANSNDAYLKKLVEIHRDLFQKLNKERMKRAGHVWVCCELLRAYFRLGQISQCPFLLNAVSQALSKDGFNPIDLPKAIAVTFHFFWGEHYVFDNNLRDADEKLSWAFNHCPPNSKNRRKILLYLVLCKLRLGVLPSKELLQSHDLGMFVDIVQAVREGNVQLYSERMAEYAADFIKMGTYLPMKRLKFMVLRSLCKGIHREVRRKDANPNTKLDLAPFEQIFLWQDGCDGDETAFLLADLIFQGAIKGYLSHEHRKLVFAKDVPFPPPARWRANVEC